jgi:hypothetical protein
MTSPEWDSGIDLEVKKSEPYIRFGRPNLHAVMTLLLFAALMAMTPLDQGLYAGVPAARFVRGGVDAGVEVQAPATSADVERKAETSNEPVPDLPVSVDRIRRKLSRPAMIRTEGDRLVFRVEVLGRKPTIEDILGPDNLKGPTPAGSPSHQDFLDLVTPEGVKGYAAFSNREAFVVAATSFALKWALQRAIHKFENAKAAIEREAARKEVQEALADLDRARARAGLPPR